MSPVTFEGTRTIGAHEYRLYLSGVLPNDDTQVVKCDGYSYVIDCVSFWFSFAGVAYHCFNYVRARIIQTGAR